MRKLIAAVSLWVSLVPTQLSAAVFTGEFWNATAQVRNMADADAVIAGGGPDATFTSTAIDYPRGNQNVISSGGTTLAQFLADDAASLMGDGSVNLTYSVFRFTGYISPSATAQTYQVGSDDGFRLTIGTGLDAVVVTSRFGQRSFGTSTGVVAPDTGLTFFELIYFENRGRTGVEFAIDGVTAVPAVPLPGGLPLLATAALGLGLIRRRATAG